MSEEIRPRYYRKNLASHGLVYIGGVEVGMSIKNISITGLLAELNDTPAITSIEDVFHAIEQSPRIDFFLPEIRIMGEAEVARAELIDGHIQIALEFCSISHDVDNALYKRRKAYRKNLVAPGLIVFNNKKYAFNTCNVSVTGLMIHLPEKIEVSDGTVTIFDFKHLNLRGQIKVIWSESANDGGTYMGLEYMHMEKTDIKGVPAFQWDKY